MLRLCRGLRTATHVQRSGDGGTTAFSDSLQVRFRVTVCLVGTSRARDDPKGCFRLVVRSGAQGRNGRMTLSRVFAALFAAAWYVSTGSRNGRRGSFAALPATEGLGEGFEVNSLSRRRTDVPKKD